MKKHFFDRYLFVFLLLGVAAASVWWTLSRSRAIRVEYRLARSELMHNAMVAALLFGQKKEKPPAGPLPGNMPLEVVALDESASAQAAAAVLPFHPDRAVRPQPQALQKIEEQYRRRRLMQFAESALLAVMLCLLGLLYFRLAARAAQPGRSFEPIGCIRTPYSPENRPPLPLAEDQAEARLELSPAFAGGLFELEKFRYLYVLFWLDRPEKSWSLRVRPPRAAGKEVGLFASRSPHRPLPVGLTVVKLKRIEGNTVITSAIDAFDGTPLLDIKPYFKQSDARDDANNGWLDEIGLAARTDAGRQS